MGADAATRLLPAALAVRARDGAGACSCAGADASLAGVTRISAASLRTSTPCCAGGVQYFRTGNAAIKFIQIDRYVEERLRGLLLKRAGSRLRPGRAEAWHRPFFEAFGLYRLRGTIQYPGAAQCRT